MLLAALLVAGCPSLPRTRVDDATLAPYPSCDGEPRPVAHGALRAGEQMRENTMRESFELLEDDCHLIARTSVDWALGGTDVEVLYDREGLPLRAWKRATSPGPQPIAERSDLRVYDLLGDPIMMRRGAEGTVESWRFRAGHPRVVIAPGRGILSMWLRRAHLAVGGRLRELAVDLRDNIEVLREVTLLRLDDRDDPELGHVRVYTIYGREPIFANDEDVVVGDMMGMRPASRVHGSLPPRLERDGPMDPRRVP